MKRILVAGATGYLGRHIVRELHQQGFHVRAIIRNGNKLKSIRTFVDEPVLAQITEPDSLKNTCSGMDIVISSVGITRQRDGLTYRDVDYQGNLNLLREALRAGVSRFIYVSVLQVPEMESVKNVRAKRAFEKALRESGLDYAILYPTAFFSDMGEYLKMAERGRGIILGNGNNRINPIHGADLARACVAAMSSPEREIPIGGPETFTHNQIMELAFAATGKPPRILHIPRWITASMVALLRWTTSVRTYGPVEFLSNALVRELVAPPFGEHRLGDFFREPYPAAEGSAPHPETDLSMNPESGEGGA